MLETMPLMQMAYIQPYYFGVVEDYRKKGDSGESSGNCVDCCGDGDHTGQSILLGGLSKCRKSGIQGSPFNGTHPSILILNVTID